MSDRIMDCPVKTILIGDDCDPAPVPTVSSIVRQTAVRTHRVSFAISRSPKSPRTLDPVRLGPGDNPSSAGDIIRADQAAEIGPATRIPAALQCGAISPDPYTLLRASRPGTLLRERRCTASSCRDPRRPGCWDSAIRD